MTTNSTVMSKEERYLQSIRELTEILGRSPTYDEYDEMEKFCTSTIENNFGTWTSAKK